MTTPDQALKMAEEANAELDPPDPTPDFVTMTHPAVHTDDKTPPATATQEAFDEVWAPRGWVLVESGETPAPAPAPKTPKNQEEG